MLRRIAIAVVIAGAFGGAMYTTLGCGGTTPSEPTPFGTVRGTVTDARTGAAISGATVGVRGGSVGISQITDSSGHYDLASPAGAVTLTASKLGYMTFTQNVNIPVNDAITIDIKLQPNQ